MPSMTGIARRRACRPDGRGRRRTDRPPAAPRHVLEAQEQLSGAMLGEMQADRRHAAGNRAADVEQIRISLGARADHRVRERDRVGFAPRDLLAEHRTHVRLIRRAGPRGDRAHLLVGEHLSRGFRGPLGRHRPVLPAASSTPLTFRLVGTATRAPSDARRSANSSVASPR